MNVIVHVDVPDLRKNLNAQDRGALLWAGVSMSMLRSSWAASLTSVLRRFWPHDHWDVRARAHPSGSPRLQTPSGTTLPETKKVELVIQTAAFAWLASIGHITMLRMCARKRASAS